ncbi:relaxase/mobilization nuclease domain-containing protein [Amphibiibacter pelophylacis]|uniref:Relaxase/mobilization nuclease domain-containing protein n=1 Tax=Amphibiibacter pelophylacis TaxID=1799477 RepID=A0ACC6P5Q7_9BURK
MSKTVIDGIIKDWGERLHYAPIKGSKGRNIRSGGSTKPAKPAPPSGPATKEKVARTAKKTAEVMVKISGGGKNMKHIKAHMDYISRNGEVEIEDENGDIHQGMEAVRDVRDSWAKGKIGIPYEGEKRKEAFNIVLSMPPGTDRQAVKDAAREFAKQEFGNHQYVFAAHDDEKHPHVHLAVKAVGNDGIRLNPRKGDLQFWREQFAEKLREQGIEANATPRRARGVVQKAEKQAVRHIDAEFEQGKRQEPARVTRAKRQDAEAEVKTGKKRANPAQDNISAARKDTQKAYGQIARALATGEAEDKQIALDIVRLVQTMPPVVTKHEALVQSLRSKNGKTAEREAEPQRPQPQRQEQGRATPGDEKTR